MQVTRRKSIAKFCLFLIFLGIIPRLQAQEKKNSPDSTKIRELFLLVKEEIPTDSSAIFTTTSDQSRRNWEGIQIGFIRFANLPQNWKALELDWNRSISFQFNFSQIDLITSKNHCFSLFSGLGLEYQRLCFKLDATSITKDKGGVKIIDLRETLGTDIHIKKSTFKNLHLIFPLMLEVQKRKFFATAGFLGGLRLHSKTKVVYKNENGDKKKEKRNGNFDMQPIKVDATIQLGYNNFCIWGSYTLTNMFQDVDIHPCRIGIGLHL